MNRRADHWLPGPVFTQYLPRLAVPGAAVSGQYQNARVGSLERHEITESGPQAAYLIEAEPRAARRGLPVSATTTLI
jgi:hypothetical protein